ncbi:MAG: hypothetical protein ACTS22_09680 [Phycisphaerales bacterium]
MGDGDHRGASHDRAEPIGERQRREQAERVAIVGDYAGAAPRRGLLRRKRAWLGLGGLALLLVVAVLPSVAGVALRGQIADALGEALGAKVRLGSVRLSWLGSQRVSELRVVDGSLREVIDVSIVADRSLLALVRDRRDLGTITVTGRAELERRADGSVVPFPPADPSRPPRTGPVRLPEGLMATLRLDGLDLTFVDVDGGRVEAQQLRGEVRLDLGSSPTASAQLDGTVADAAGSPGRVSLDATAERFVGASGVLSLPTIRGEVTLAVDGVPSSLFSWLTGQPIDALGPEVTLRVEAAGHPEEGTASVSLQSEQATAQVAASFGSIDGTRRVMVREGGLVRAEPGLVRRLSPALAELADRPTVLESGGVFELAEVPGLTLRLGRAVLPVQESGSPAWSEASVVAAVEVDGLSGSLNTQAWAIEPLELSASSVRLGSGVRLSGATTATLADELAGVLAIAAEGLVPVDADGAWSADPATLLASGSASIEANDVRTGIVGPLLSPILERFGVEAERDLGPSFAVELSLQGRDDPRLVAFVESANVRGRAGLVLDGSVLRTDAGGVELRVGSAAAVLSELLGDMGVAVDRGAGVDLSVRDLRFDTAGWTGADEADLRSLSGLVDVSVTETGLRYRPMADSEGEPVEARQATLEASSFRLDLSDLAGEVAISGRTSALVEGEPAGELVVALTARELVDGRGRLRPGVPPIEGELTVNSARVALAEPWLSGVPSDVVASIGDRITVRLVGRRSADEVVQIDTSVVSSALRGGGGMEIRDRVLSVVGDGLAFEIDNPVALVSRLVPALSPTATVGAARLEIAEGVFGVGSDRDVRPHGRAALTLSGAAWTDASGQRLGVDRAGVVVALDEQGDGSLEISAALQHADRPMLAAGRMTLPGLLDESAGVRPFEASPEGRFDLTGVPVSLAGLLTDLTESDPRPLAEDLIGETVDAALVASGGSVDLTLTGSTGTLTGGISALVGGGSVRVERGEVRVRVDPEVLRQARLRDLQAGDAEGLMLASPAELDLRLGAFSLVTGHAWRPAGDPELRLTGSAVVSGVRRGDDSGSLGVEGLVLSGRVPIGALLGPERSPLSGRLQGGLVGADGAPLGRLEGELHAGFAGGVLDGDMALSVALVGVDAGVLDETFGMDNALAGALGARGDAQLVLAGGVESGRLRDARAEASLRSPRLTTEAPVRLAIAPDRIVLEEPATLRWQIDPAFGTRHLLGQEPGREEARLAKATRATVVLDRLAIGRGDRPMRADVFDLSASFEAPAIVFEHLIDPGPQVNGPPTDPSAWTMTSFVPVNGSLRTEPGEGRSLEVSIDAVGAGNERITLAGRLRAFAGEGGEEQIDETVLDATLEARQTPAVLVDAVFGLRGWFAETMGPRINARAEAQSLSPRSGKLNSSLTGDRASLRVIGEVREGVFTTTEPIAGELSVIRPELGRRISAVVPVLGEVTKTVQDGPATVTIDRVVMPLEGNGHPFASLDADFVVDVGTAQFKTGALFQNLVKAVTLRTEGEVGRRIEPMVGTVRHGRLAYERFKIPLGEFTLLSEGSYDFGSRRLGVTTYIPLGALTDQAMGILNTGLGSRLSRLIPGLERLTMIPWKVSGTPGNLTVQPDIDALTRDLTRLLNPVNVIDGVFNGVREGLGF